jgi:hypothetical protein
MKQTNKPAGGLGSRVVKDVGVRTGQPARGISPRGVSQIGASIGNHSTDQGTNLSYKGEKWFDGKTPAGGAVKLGNELATRVGKGGPGADRTVMRCGSQTGVSPTRSPNASGRDILGSFGPDSAIVRKR